MLSRAEREKLVAENYRWLRHTANKMAAGRLGWDDHTDDAVQVGALSLWASAQRFDPERRVTFLSFAGRSAALTMFAHLTRAVAENKAATGPSVDLDRNPWPERSDDGPSAATLRRLDRAMRKLTPTQRHAVRHSFGLDGRPAMTAAQVARAEGIDPHAARLRIYSGIAALSRHLGGCVHAAK